MYLFKGATFYAGGKLAVGEVVLSGDTVSLKASPIDFQNNCISVEAHNLLIIPGFLDVHVHLREPGFFYKESVLSGTTAAASAGYSALCAMPNLNPVPDNAEKLASEEEIIKRDAKLRVYPYGALTVDEKGQKLSDMEALAPRVAAFSDDGTGLNDRALMREAMQRAKALDKIIAAHCEDLKLRDGGYIHKGAYAAAHNHLGISSESEWKPIERDLSLAKETGCAYHVCHISAKESVALIRDAKNDGVKVTCETAPHYLLLSDECLREDGRFKMNPPLRSKADREALLEGFYDGTIDILATDHAPHTDEEKSRGLKGSAMGVIGLETAFPVLYTKLVKTGLIPLERLLEAMCVAPRRIFRVADGIVSGSDYAADKMTFEKHENIKAQEDRKNRSLNNTADSVDITAATKTRTGGFARNGGIYDGCAADIAVINLDKKWTVRGKDCLSKGNSTPFEGEEVFAKCEYNFLNGVEIWKNGQEN